MIVAIALHAVFIWVLGVSMLSTPKDQKETQGVIQPLQK